MSDISDVAGRTADDERVAASVECVREVVITKLTEVMISALVASKKIHVLKRSVLVLCN